MSDENIFANIFFVVVVLIYFLFPPKKKNWFYGYRTSAAMRSNENFALINKKASQYFMKFTLACLAVNIISILLFKTDLSIVTILCSVVLTIVATETFIKTNYRNGTLK
jgi:uncharacterized membrane protein